jgi:hypothetical protein
MAEESDRKQKRGRNFIVSAFLGAITIALVRHFAPHLIPFDPFSFWTPRGGVGDWLWAAWPAFAYGIGVNVIAAYRDRKDPELRAHPEAILVVGTLVSLWAGIMEEICFRWLIFLSTIFWVQVGNFLLLGFMGWGIPEHLYLWVVRHVADFTTLGGLHDVLFSAQGWFVGAAMLSANAFFRDGHKYQGLKGWISSWFMGMFFFWIMFRFGLPAAILVHLLYDLFIFVVHWVDTRIERAMYG